MTLISCRGRGRLQTVVHDLVRERDEIFRNPTVEGGMKFWNYELLGEPISDNTVLAGIHKARLFWKDATPQMISESIDWLVEHKFNIPKEFKRNDS